MTEPTDKPTTEQMKRYLWHPGNHYTHFTAVQRDDMRRAIEARLLEHDALRRMLQDPDLQDVLNLREERDALKAEVEENNQLIHDLTTDMNDYHDRAEKAEAELVKVQQSLVSLQAKHSDLDRDFWELQRDYARFKAELAAARPLLEAAMATDLHQNGPNAREPGKVWIAQAEHHQPLLRAALAYREKKEGKK